MLGVCPSVCVVMGGHCSIPSCLRQPVCVSSLVVIGLGFDKPHLHQAGGVGFLPAGTLGTESHGEKSDKQDGINC